MFHSLNTFSFDFLKKMMYNINREGLRMSGYDYYYGLFAFHH